MPQAEQGKVDRGERIALTDDLISVIIPVYKVEKYLGRCLDSLQRQTYPHFEALLVDDGSPDESARIAADYQKNDPRFHLITKENGGQGSARNRGLDQARGKYVMFVDSDDWVDERYMETLLRCLIANDADIAICGVERVWDSGVRRRNPISNTREYVIPDVKEFMLSASNAVWDKLYKRELLEGLRFPEGITFEDFAFTPQALERAKRIVAIPDPLYFYYWRGDSTTTRVKINRDIYAAYQALAQSPFGQRCEKQMTAYFIRIVMGSLLWALCHEKGHRDEVERIMTEGKEKYPELNALLDRCIEKGKGRFGHALLRGNYPLARLYAASADGVKSLLRPLYHRLLSLKRG